MTQDDAHIFCTREQMADELASLLDFVLDLLRDYGLDDFYLELSTKPEEKAVGSDEDWDEATETLRQVGEAKGLELVLDEGGGAFYGPKISVQARDAIGRTWQMSTIQLDFQGPQRFDLDYVGADNERHRPIMIHRALFGSIERFFARARSSTTPAPSPRGWRRCRPWCARSPPSHEDYAHSVARRLRAAGIRVDVSLADEGLGARIRKLKLDKVPHILVVGDDDVANGTVADNDPRRRQARARHPRRRLRRPDRRRDPRPLVSDRLDRLWAGLAHGLHGRGHRRRKRRSVVGGRIGVHPHPAGLIDAGELTDETRLRRPPGRARPSPSSTPTRTAPATCW